jgi:hypothetical protein
MLTENPQHVGSIPTGSIPKLFNSPVFCVNWVQLRFGRDDGLGSHLRGLILFFGDTAIYLQPLMMTRHLWW